MKEALKEFILSHENWEELLTADPYNLKVQRKDDYILFKYNQISSHFNLPEVQEARGIIFYEPNWTCVCRAFDKFGNWGEGFVKDIDWDSGVSVQEKVDGSLMKCWYHNKKWHLSTNGSIDAFETPTGDAIYPTFGALFEKALKDMNQSDGIFNVFAEENLCEDIVYMFELVSPVNKVVVPYKYFGLYYLGDRDMRTMEEGLHRDEWEDFYLPKLYPMSTLDEVSAAASILPFDEEGYVCVDAHFNRLKIKSPEYVKAHHILNNGNGTTLGALVNVIINGEQEEFLIYAPDYRDKLKEIEDTMKEIASNAFDSLLEVYGVEKIDNRGEFAKKVLKKPSYQKDFLFHCFNERIFFDYAQKWTADKWVKTIEEYQNSKGEL